ncbi:MAG: DUF2905 domain-containing protein [Candidatus Rokubacteria bacterium]|nr:DUF2905 domain-containing protein [Candidatus Rokubacteria bacterium]
MAEMGKLLIGFGVLLIIIGGLLVLSGGLADKVPFVGRLPGDIHIQRGNWSFYFPLTTSILVSVILTLILTFLFRR